MSHVMARLRMLAEGGGHTSSTRGGRAAASLRRLLLPALGYLWASALSGAFGSPQTRATYCREKVSLSVARGPQHQHLEGPTASSLTVSSRRLTAAEAARLV